jgi:hypothetical protein
MSTSTDKICLGSADGHVGPPTLVYRDYLEKHLYPLFDDYYQHHVWRWAVQSKDSFLPANYNAAMRNTEGFDPSHGSPVAWDPNMRLKAQDQAGLAAETFFPDDQNRNDPPWGSGLATASVDGPGGSKEHPAELVRAGARAYNRWMADFCSTDPNRLRGITILGTMEDVLWCVDEIVRAYESGLTTGIMLPLDYYQPLYHHPRYDIVWQTCSELNLSVASHVSRGHPHYLGEDPWVQRFMYLQECGWYALRPVWCMIMGGTLERFPDLRLVITELGAKWVAPMLQGLDASFNMWPKMQASRDVPRKVNFTMTPSEYFKRQCFVAHTTSQERADFEGEAYDNVPNMVFGMDVGHNEGWWPVFGFQEPIPEGNPPGQTTPAMSIEAARRSIWGGLASSSIMPYLQDNFFRAYPMIDRAALQDVVDRVGPTPNDIGLL